MATLCKAGATLRDQLNAKFPKRDKRSDGWIGDLAHSQRFSYHNPDSHGIVWALDIDENFGKGTWRNGYAAMRLANQLAKYAKSGLPGGDRIMHIVYEDRVISGTYKDFFWVWRGKGYGHTQHIHITFQIGKGAQNALFPVPILANTKGLMSLWAKQLANGVRKSK